MPRRIAVAVHGIEPATFERCALIRDWLADHGLERVTLLVIPARDMHPVGERSPAMVGWLEERRRAGDSIAQHGFHHASTRPPLALGVPHARRRGEFAGMDEEETRRAVNAGWRVLKLAGIEPDGFVAPSYAYTTALRRALSSRFQWWADLLYVHLTEHSHGQGREPLTPAWSLSAGGPLARALCPTLVSLGARLPTPTLRLDVHPAYLQHHRHMRALESVLARAGGRLEAVTYGELAENSEASNDLTAGSAA
jgi:predicted deacetylase